MDGFNTFMDLVDKVILWNSAVVGTIYGDGDGDSFKGGDFITIYHNAHVSIGVNVNVGEELTH